MNNSNNNKEKHSKEYYNAIPVTYCKNCLSLRILILDSSTDYCDECGCTNMGTTDIESWEKMYEERYGKPFNQ